MGNRAVAPSPIFTLTLVVLSAIDLRIRLLPDRAPIRRSCCFSCSGRICGQTSGLDALRRAVRWYAVIG